MRYKLRFEAPNDFFQLINLCVELRTPLTALLSTNADTVSFESQVPLDTLRAHCQMIPDGHVMAETIALERHYTGDRRE